MKFEVVRDVQAKVVRLGDQLAVLLPDEIAASLGALDGATLPVEETGTGVRLGRATNPGVRPEVMSAYQESHERYAELYKRLAE